MIRRNVELEARLIDDLLDVTRIAKGKLHSLSKPSPFTRHERAGPEKGASAWMAQSTVS